MDNNNIFVEYGSSEWFVLQEYRQLVASMRVYFSERGIPAKPDEVRTMFHMAHSLHATCESLAAAEALYTAEWGAEVSELFQYAKESRGHPAPGAWMKRVSGSRYHEIQKDAMRELRAIFEYSRSILL